MDQRVDDLGRYYMKARKQGQREYKMKVAKGENGYLNSLEGLINNVDIVSEEALGIVEIPLEKVKGTFSRSRAHAFASNFMPLLNIQSEFSAKWTGLVLAHLEEGIRDPIKVYEYMNYFYVIEGNKRVSVLKFFNAYSLRGQATRLVPRKDADDSDNILYYEFLKFYRKSKINDIWFTRRGSFDRMLKIMEEYDYDSLASDRYTDFMQGVFFPFRSEYKSLGGNEIPGITTGDAFLEYVSVYGIPGQPAGNDLSMGLKSFIEELKLMSGSDRADVVEKPESMEGTGFISGLASRVAPSRKLKIAFVYPGNITNSNWSYSHEMGRRHVAKVFGSQVKADFHENVPDNPDAYTCFNSLAQEDYDIVFAASPGYINTVLKAALEHNDTKFFCCSETRSFKNVTTYFGRIYEARFLAGIVSGIATNTDLLGYVGTYPLPGTISGVNAFALGARLVNPRVKVIVHWTREWTYNEKFEKASSQLVRSGADIVCHQNTLTGAEISKEYGVYSMVCSMDSVNCRPSSYIASPVWNWGVFYERIIRQILGDVLKSVAGAFRAKPVSFWWGIDSGVVDFFFSSSQLSPDTIKLVTFMKNMIASYEYHPFTGPVHDQEGKIRIKSGERPSRELLLGMDWFVDAVETKLEKVDRKDIFGDLPGLFT